MKETFESMIQSIVRAVIDEKLLLLAKPSVGGDTSAMFVSQKNLAIGSFVFTSFGAADDSTSKNRYRFLDNFVSLQIDRVGHVDSTLARVQGHEWVNGVWLPQLCDMQKVVFPWPSSLQGWTP